ncbi:DUF3857 domain-containing transglutaminase family protein [Confluentibacter flavum]|uniref:DUF3857 domain-containing protein n=1 Tax=Confluentibacter flavum TaxID=1909700 RepID=A0A2N3HGB4_9FLAO|nr:DUF3857 domain-containing transglutaminase family protein [Confluentibacter flavum]PKQ44016.1 hypothetical protein CSW08_15445 [Confluentibacter flavum]
MRIFIIGFIAFLCFSTAIQAQVTKETEPSWLDDIHYSKSDIDIDDVSQGTHTLLYDTQINIPKQTIFYRVTTKVTDNVGIQNASTINISYDPSYQKLKFHKIHIIRNNEIIDKLNISNIEVMRRELNAESHLYDGALSAVMNISDVRTDDIIDYSYSIIGFNPIHKNIYSTNFFLNDFKSVGKIHVTLLSKNKLNYKAFNTSAEPVISKVNDLNKYEWEATNTKKIEFEDEIPIWKLIYETVFISEFNSWKDVVDWGLDIYKIDGKVNTELQAKIDEINSSYETNGEKIKATLNFVQNEIRYLGLENGIGSYKPFSPNQVFKQRFGDCKDKSLLMVNMLTNMGIEAYPVLVNTYLKQTIKDLLPSPKIFDHCVVKVIDGSAHWYDPTMTNQGGYHDSTHFPDYAYGLVIKKDNDSFDDIKLYSENKVETFEEYTIDSIGKGARLKVITIYHGGEADAMRNYFKNNSINSIQKEYEKFYSNYYYNVSSLKTPQLEDKLNLNTFKIYEEYQLDSIWKPMPEKINHISATFLPSSLLNSLYIPNNDKRDSELSIVYPITREHQIKIKLPIDWGIKNEKLYVTSPGFYYEWKVDYDRKQKTINLNYYLKTLKDHVTPDEFRLYNQDAKKVDQSTAYIIYIPKNFSQSNSISNGANVLFDGIMAIVKLLFIIGIIVTVGLLIFWYSQNRKAK